MVDDIDETLEVYSLHIVDDDHAILALCLTSEQPSRLIGLGTELAAQHGEDPVLYLSD
jgi:hypothetical protein